jgi:enoyl-CoA hydratase/carnithine racemase
LKGRADITQLNKQEGTMNKLSITHNDGIATVMINNPPVNVLTIDLINEVNALVLSLKDDRDTKVVVFKSCHEAFFLAMSE